MVVMVVEEEVKEEREVAVVAIVEAEVKEEEEEEEGKVAVAAMVESAAKKAEKSLKSWKRR